MENPSFVYRRIFGATITGSMLSSFLLPGLRTIVAEVDVDFSPLSMPPFA